MHCKFLITVFSTSILLSGCTESFKKEPGVYINKDPYFIIKYPKEWIPGIKFPETVLSVVSAYMTPNLIVHVMKSEACWILKDAPEKWIYHMRIMFPKTSNYEILSKKAVSVNDGTEAIKAKISWTWEDGTNLLTSFIAANKDNRRITAVCTGIEQIPYDSMEKITNSLSFSK